MCILSYNAKYKHLTHTKKGLFEGHMPNFSNKLHFLSRCSPVIISFQKYLHVSNQSDFGIVHCLEQNSLHIHTQELFNEELWSGCDVLAV